MSWRNDLVRSGGGVWFWFCGTLSWPGLPRWRGEKQRQDRRGVPSCSRLTRNGAKPPSPRDVTAVGAWAGTRAVCRSRLPDITTCALRLGFFHTSFISATPPPPRLLRLRIAMGHTVTYRHEASEPGTKPVFWVRSESGTVK
jgi:hypothetical protein